jgi:thiamine-phosphate pyrophosphorylase
MFPLPKFYPILDSRAAAARGMDPVAVAVQLVSAGVAILQFRHKGSVTRETFASIEKIAAVCRAAGVPLVVNDRADLAVLASAALHLGQDDLPPRAARRVAGSGTVIGFSTHNEAQLRAAADQPVDYVALGPIFGTASKQNPDPVVGVAELRRLRPLTDRPLVAIGGITRENARSVIDAGADSVAVIGDLFPDDGDIAARAKQWLSVLSR